MMWNSFRDFICEIWRSGTMRRKYFCCLFFFFFSAACISLHVPPSLPTAASLILFIRSRSTDSKPTLILIRFWILYFVFFPFVAQCSRAFVDFVFIKIMKLAQACPISFFVGIWLIFFCCVMLCRFHLSYFNFHKYILQMMTYFLISHVSHRDHSISSCIHQVLLAMYFSWTRCTMHI